MTRNQNNIIINYEVFYHQRKLIFLKIKIITKILIKIKKINVIINQCLIYNNLYISN